MNVFVIIPVNKLSDAKSRLSSILSPQERKELVLCMLQDVLDCLRGLEVVITSPQDLTKSLRGYVFHFVLDEEQRLNAAVKKSNKYAIEKGADATLFIPADLPLISREQVKEIIRLGEKHPLIISPSRRGGTGIMFRRPPWIIDEHFGPNSFLRHKEEALLKKVEMFVYDSYLLSLDIDTPEDAKEFLIHGKGTRTYAYLKTRF
jgi:2-phospho-L-lactate guanylyltransferase